jgi:hypothetical protein
MSEGARFATDPEAFEVFYREHIEAIHDSSRGASPTVSLPRT